MLIIYPNSGQLSIEGGKIFSKKSFGHIEHRELFLFRLAFFPKCGVARWCGNESLCVFPRDHPRPAAELLGWQLPVAAVSPNE